MLRPTRGINDSIVVNTLHFQEDATPPALLETVGFLREEGLGLDDLVGLPAGRRIEVDLAEGFVDKRDQRGRRIALVIYAWRRW